MNVAVDWIPLRIKCVQCIAWVWQVQKCAGNGIKPVAQTDFGCDEIMHVHKCGTHIRLSVNESDSCKKYCNRAVI